MAEKHTHYGTLLFSIHDFNPDNYHISVLLSNWLTLSSCCYDYVRYVMYVITYQRFWQWWVKCTINRFSVVNTSCIITHHLDVFSIHLSPRIFDKYCSSIDQFLFTYHQNFSMDWYIGGPASRSYLHVLVGCRFQRLTIHQSKPRGYCGESKPQFQPRNKK